MTGFHWYFGVVQASAGAAALSISVVDGEGGTSATTELESPAAAGTLNFPFGDLGITLTATASGGAGGNSFAWTNTELSDSDGAGGTGVWSVGSTGTTNQATYDDMAISCNVSGGSAGQEMTAQYRITCTVTDSAGATASANFTLNLRAIISE